MYVPMAVPVTVGQPIRVTAGGFDRPEFRGLSQRPLDATIVRVERRGVLEDGHLPVGVRFNQPVA